MYWEGHEEAQEELPKKAKFFLSTAVQKWDADFFVKVDDNIDLDLGNALTYSFSFPEHHSLVYSEFWYIIYTVFWFGRGVNWTSWTSSWSRWCIHWVYEVRRCDIWRVYILLYLFLHQVWLLSSMTDITICMSHIDYMEGKK